MLRRLLPLIIAGGMLAGLAGCVDSKYTNQGGASLISIIAKLGQNPSDPPIGSLNPDEWQYLSDNAASLASQLGYELPPELTIPSLTDDQAQAIYDFLAANGVSNVSDLQELADRIQQGQVVVPDNILDIVEQMTGRPIPD